MVKLDKVFDKLKELGRDKKNRKVLIEFVDKIDWDIIEELVTTRLISSAGPEVLNALFLALSDTPQRLTKKNKIIRTLLKGLHQPNTPSTAVRMLLTVVLLELPKLPADSIAVLAEDCVDSIRKNDDPHTSWKDLFPECLRLLSEHCGLVNHCGSLIKGVEFASQCVGSLCHATWHSSIVTPLAAMFREVKLTKDEHLQVVNKLCFDLDNLEPESLPSLLHQLLRLCKEQNATTAYFRLSDYFTSRLYPQLMPTDQDHQESESPMVDFDMIEPADDATRRAHATCILFAGCDSCVPRHLLNTLKLGTRRPALLLSSPTLVQLLLANAQQRETCIQIIKSSLTYNILEKLKRQEFTWCADALPKPIDAELLFKTLVDSSGQHCHMTSAGLLALSLSLMAVPPLAIQTSQSAELSRLGRQILGRLGEGAVREALRSLEHAPQTSLPDTLEALFRLAGPVLAEASTELRSILENCFAPGADVRASSRVLRLLAPGLRDTTIMLCRKGQFSRDPGVGRVAVTGFLSLLGCLSCSREGFSQDNSGHSVLTQISIDVHSRSTGSRSRVNNAAVCSEIVSLLRKCLNQSWEVREQLYLGLPPAMAKKPQLLDMILELLHEHLSSRFLASGNDAVPPLLIDKCVAVRDETAILQEPIGTFLFSLHKMVERSNDIDEGDFTTTLADLLKSIAARMANCTAPTFNLDESVSLGDLNPEAATNSIVVRQTLQVCEALMAHCVVHSKGTVVSVDAKTLLGLHKTYCQLLDFVKSNSRPKKHPDKGSKRTQKSQKEAQNKEEPKKRAKKKGRDGPLKLSEMSKDRGGTFKQPVSVWDVVTVYTMLQLLHREDSSWCKKDDSNQIRTNRLLHRFVVKAGLRVLKSQHGDNLTSTHISELSNIAAILYEHCVKRLNDFADFDHETALLVVELFHELFLAAAASGNDDQLLSFLDALEETDAIKSSNLSDCISSVAETVAAQILSTSEGSIETEDPSAAKISPALLRLLNSLLGKIASNTPHCNKWAEWLTTLCSAEETSKWLGALAVPSLLTISARSASPWSAADMLLQALTKIMGTNGDDTEQPTGVEYDGPLNCLCKATALALLGLSQHLSRRLGAAELVAGRLRGELVGLPYRRSLQQHFARAALKNRERLLCFELLHLSGAAMSLARLPSPTGACCAAVSKLLARLHALLAGVAQHFASRGAPAMLAARFDRVVKLAGRPLSKAVDAFIDHVEGASTLDTSAGTSKGRGSQDTKHIPRLVYEMEHFCKRIVQLSTKTKLDLVCHLSRGSARDFRIKASAVREALGGVAGGAEEGNEEEEEERVVEGEESIIDEIDAAIDGADLDGSDEATSNRQSDDSDGTDIDIDEEEIKPPSKKKRLSSSP